MIDTGWTLIGLIYLALLGAFLFMPAEFIEEEQKQKP